MKRLLLLAILLALLAPAQAQNITGEWKVEYTTPTLEQDGVLSGGTTVVTSKGEATASSWSSGAAPPSKVDLGKVDPEVLDRLEAAMVSLLRVKYNEPGSQTVQFALTHAEHRLLWRWQEGNKELPDELKAAVQAFRAAVKSAKENEG